MIKILNYNLDHLSIRTILDLRFQNTVPNIQYSFKKIDIKVFTSISSALFLFILTTLFILKILNIYVTKLVNVIFLYNSHYYIPNHIKCISNFRICLILKGRICKNK